MTANSLIEMTLPTIIFWHHVSHCDILSLQMTFANIEIRHILICYPYFVKSYRDASL